MNEKLKKLYNELYAASHSGRIDEEFLEYVDRLQDEIQKLEEETKVPGQP